MSICAKLGYNFNDAHNFHETTYKRPTFCYTCGGFVSTWVFLLSSYRSSIRHLTFLPLCSCGESSSRAITARVRSPPYPQSKISQFYCYDTAHCVKKLIKDLELTFEWLTVPSLNQPSPLLDCGINCHRHCRDQVGRECLKKHKNTTGSCPCTPASDSRTKANSLGASSKCTYTCTTSKYKSSLLLVYIFVLNICVYA